MKEDARMSVHDGLSTIDGPAAWRGPALSRSEEWIYHLSDAEAADVERLVLALRRGGTPREELTRDDVPLGALAAAVRDWRAALARGRGFVLVRGLPVARM